MKVKVSEIVDSAQTLNKVLNCQIPVKLAYRLKRMADAVKSVLKTFTKERNALVIEYGEPNEKGEVIVKEENKEKFMSEVDELTSVVVELNAEPIPFTLLEEAGMKLSANDMVILESFISKPE